jgi:hypothetical protein
VTESPNAAADVETRVRPTRRLRALRWLLWAPAVALIGVGVATSAGLLSPGVDDAPPVRELGVGWKTIDVSRSTTGSGYTIHASIDRDRLDGARANRHSDYVLWMLADGRWDDTPWTDSWGDETALGMSHEQALTIIPVEEGEDREFLVDSGHYTPSVDGSITYDRIPPGEYELRALVMRDGGIWDGTIATRTIEVS